MDDPLLSNDLEFDFLEQELNEESGQNLEDSIKQLLENIIKYLEKFISSKDEVKLIEDKLHDYENSFDLIEITKTIFNYLCQKIDKKFQNDKTPNENSINNNQEEYLKLEKQVQKYENEIRNRIRMEQSLKLYGESLQQKLDEIEQQKKEMETESQKTIDELISVKQSLIEVNQEIKKENLEWKIKYEQLEKNCEQLKDEILNQQISNSNWAG